MMQVLNPNELTVSYKLSPMSFESTETLLEASDLSLTDYGWKLQPEAQKTLMMGLSMQQSGCNVLVQGTPGSGRAGLTMAAMKAAAVTGIDTSLTDLVALYDFSQQSGVNYIKLPAGLGSQLRTVMDIFIKTLMAEMPQWLDSNGQANLSLAEVWLEERIDSMRAQLSSAKLSPLFNVIKPEILAYLQAWQQLGNEPENNADGLVNEGFLSRFRVNLLVDQRANLTAGVKQPIVEEKDPGFAALFGTLESAAGEAAQWPEFLRLRAGSLHHADGGMLMLHLRDLMQDESNGGALLEKLYRLMRNHEIQIEDWANHAQQGTGGNRQSALPVNVKLIMIASREDYYDCLEAQPDFFDFFPVKVEFEDRVSATLENYAWVAGYIAQKCQQQALPHFSGAAVNVLLQFMHRLEEDQSRFSIRFAHLDQLMHESAAAAGDERLVTDTHVNQALSARLLRQQFFEAQIRDSIIDNELLIQVHGDVVGQVNGLTHIELGDASFGSPIRITARCYPGRSGVINIDREVEMSGPSHDKGIYILQNWLSASFWALAPLSLSASLVFEQEYNGVEGDSASCAELFALLSALTGLPIKQGIAVTGALNQFGEVMPIGGVNEKIEGYFRVCQALGLNGEQGVIIPKRNQRHLILDESVVTAVNNGMFKIITIDHVLEGIAYLTNSEAGTQEADGTYTGNTLMARAQTVLASFRATLERNQAHMAYIQQQADTSKP
ncbi:MULTISPECIES: Lon protease family protein [unclassified Methylophilus]|jgi:predicted ATP-dependent protease|uniref:Lon protease family protein n=1 Tax=unclassified Methylophilus TaxID=2630143 RepID=UPI0006FB8730|nr:MULTISPECIES: AAA family ATPase [unclassified Methylophilus]KQT43520.1 ATP-dependent protease [Methylophilus sp. Leaf416]KQT59006.1 ATP-dependent protease [Methylophilus sp. Leaf459]